MHGIKQLYFKANPGLAYQSSGIPYFIPVKSTVLWSCFFDFVLTAHLGTKDLVKNSCAAVYIHLLTTRNQLCCSDPS